MVRRYQLGATQYSANVPSNLRPELSCSRHRVSPPGSAARASTADISNPGDADTVANLDGIRINATPESDNTADTLMAKNIASWANMAGRKRNVCPANTSCGEFDENFPGLKFWDGY